MVWVTEHEGADPELDLLACDTERCGGSYPTLGSRSMTKQGARARGWAVFEGITIGGEPLVVHQCAVCVAWARQEHRRKVAETAQELVPGQEGLWIQ